MKEDTTNSKYMEYRQYIASLNSLNSNLGGVHLGRWPTEVKREHRVCIYDFPIFFLENEFVQKNSDLWQEQSEERFMKTGHLYETVCDSSS